MTAIFHPATAAAIARDGGGSVGQRFAVLLGAAFVLLLVCGFGPNLDLAALSLAVLVIGCAVLWRPGESPVLALTFGLPWLGASAAVFHANWLDVDIVLYSNFGGQMRPAVALSLVGLLCMALGMRLGAGARRPRDAASARSTAGAQPPSRWFWLYGVTCAAAFAAAWLGAFVPALAQLVVALMALRWAFYFVLAYASFLRGGRIGPGLPLAFAGELAIGIGGYFSDFRAVFLLTICAAAASGLRLTFRRQAVLATLVAGLLCLGVVWSGVKMQYRLFVSDGRNEQVVAVDYLSRLGKLAELAGAMDAHATVAGLDALLHRLSYVEYFSVVLDYVPSQMEHGNGALFADAVSRPFMPRALFPEKGVIDDTERTNLYTGGLAGNDGATSISLGYVAEAYIDFGRYGMMAALFAVGCAYGGIYQWLLRSKLAGSLVGMGLASAALMMVGSLDNSITKVAGGLAAYLIVAWAYVRFAVPLALTWTARPGDAR